MSDKEPQTPAAAETAFSAADAALGYLFQVRFALLRSLRKLGDDASFAIHIETLDDVVFDQPGSPLELLQLKHHQPKAANLSDASADLWKTLRVWMQGRAGGDIPPDAELCLVTTADVSDGSAAAYLRAAPDGRDEVAATSALLATARTSSSAVNSAAYSLFLDLNEDERAALVAAIVILPKSVDIHGLDIALRREIWSASRSEHREQLLSRLEGWWYERVVRQLRSPASPPIYSGDIQVKIDDLREQFHQDALPIDEDIFSLNVDLTYYEQSPFVQQLELSGINQRRIFRAVQDFYRAFAQRSRWVREDLIDLGELKQYERRLVEEWEIVFDQVADELGTDAAEEASRDAAQKLCKWAEDADFPIRPRVSERSLTRGSLHMLADELRVGWHPRFREHLRHLLSSELAE